MDLTARSTPDGFTSEHDSTLWNVGHVFRWSSVFDCWLDESVRISIKPHEAIADSFRRHIDEPMWPEYAVFFADA